MNMRIWYMRDNHTFLSLPLDVEGVCMTKITIDRAVVEQALHVATGAGYPVALIAALRAALAQQAEPETTCRRAICQRGPDGYCAPCHERMYP